MFNRQQRLKMARISLVHSQADDGKPAEPVEIPSVQPPVAQAPTVPATVVQEVEIGTLR